MKHFDDILPEETEADSQPLLEELRRAYRPELHDARILARIREHLLAGDSRQKQISFTQQRERTATIDMPKERGKTLKPKTWRHTMGLVAAVLIVSLLVASLVLTFTLAHRNTTGTGPLPAQTRPETLIEIHMFSASTGWAVLTENRVIRTTDGGVSWHEVTPPDILNLEKSSTIASSWIFYTAVTAWVSMTVSGQQASAYHHSATTLFLFHTTDGGKTWQKTTLELSGKTGGQVAFINDQVGWLLSEPAPATQGQDDIWHTIDGGKHWTEILDGSSPGAQNLNGINILDISFGSAQVGLMLGINNNSLYLYRTIDGGVTWHLQPQPAVPVNDATFGEIQFFTANDALFSVSIMPYDRSGVAQKGKVIVYTTHDAGLTWHTSPTLSLAVPSGKRAPADWRYDFIESTFLDMKHGWTLAVTESKTMETSQSGLIQYMTTDGGEHWTQLPVNSFPNGYRAGLSYNFTSPSIGWLTGNNTQGKIALFKTVDGGRNWVQVHAHFPAFIRGTSTA